MERLQRLCAHVIGAAAPLSRSPESFTPEEVAKHSTEEDCWLIISGAVYDVSSFLRSHPGGILPVLPFAGKDATAVFEELHEPAWLSEFGARYQVGWLRGGREALNGEKSPRTGKQQQRTLTPRASKLFISPNPRAVSWPSGFPKAVRWLHSRYVPRAMPLPLSLRPLSSVPGEYHQHYLQHLSTIIPLTLLCFLFCLR